MTQIEDELRDQVTTLSKELDVRAAKAEQLEGYYVDVENPPIPDAIRKAQVTKAYQTLMPAAIAPWGSLVVDSVTERLEPTGILCGEDEQGKKAADAAWKVWQANQMDSEAGMLHNSTLIAGRAFATVWPGRDKQPRISLDTAAQMIVQYEEGDRRMRRAALRRWVDDDEITSYATLYRPDGIYKFQTRRPGMNSRIILPTGYDSSPGTEWVRRDVPDEPWPLPNRFNVVPVVEFAVNRRLKPGSFGYARGEYEHCVGLIDRIHMLTFLGLVVAFWMGFPLRVVIGDKILRDDDGRALPPFEAGADQVAQFENPQARIDEYKAADRKNLSVYAELDQLSSITKTPRHYMPMEGAMANLSADAIRASDGGLVAKIPGHKRFLGESHEETLRLAGMMAPEKFDIPAHAALSWTDHETRSLAERADAATKLKDLLPWQAIAERVLNATADDITRWETQRASDGMTQLLAAVAAQPPAPAPPTA